MKWFKSLRMLFALQAIVGALLVVGSSGLLTGIVNLHYPRIIDNDPLLAPVGVAACSGNRITLCDGRIIEVEQWHTNSAAGSTLRWVDIEPYSDGSVFVLTSERGWLCGTPWCALISIPLIPDDVPINHRRPVAMGRVRTEGLMDGPD